MRRSCQFIVLSLLIACAALHAGTAQPESAVNPNAPFFIAAGIVQAATQTAGPLAPNTLGTIYGTNLSWTTHAVTPGDFDGTALPDSLDGVTVYVAGFICKLLYISPGQINFLMPYEITGPTATVLVARQGVAGPVDASGIPLVSIGVSLTAPGFFQWSGNFIVAEHANGSLITPASPAQAGEVVVLFAAGLGRTSPDSASGVPPTTAMPILYASQLQILLNGNVLPPQSIYYAGVTPGFAGLYQINVTLPDVLPPDPAIQVVIGNSAVSPPNILLFTE